MNAIALGAPASYTLNQLNTWVAQKEGIYGPLVDMGHNGQQSTFAFDQDTDPPAKNAILRAVKVGNSGPANSTVIIQNEAIFVSNVLTPSMASRPN